MIRNPLTALCDVLVQLKVSTSPALPTSIDAAHVAPEPTHAVAEPSTKLTAGSNEVPGVTVTVIRCPAGMLTRYMRSSPCVPRQPFAVPEVKSFAYPVSEWFTLAGNVSSGAVAHVSPVSPLPPVQLPEEHVWLFEHVVHAAPLTPHAEVDVPPRHTSPEQHPLGQVVALQVATHCVPLHTCALEHEPHVAPPLPHAAPVVPDKHTPF
jgi:hypothetical protein